MKKIKILVLTAILVWVSTFVFSKAELMAASPSDRRFRDFLITTDNALDSVDIAANQAYVNFSSSITLRYFHADGGRGDIYNNTLQAGSSITETITPGAEIVKLTFPAHIDAVWPGADNKIIIQFNGSGNTDMEIPLTEFNVPDTQKTIDLPPGTTSYKIVFPQDTQISNALPLYDNPAALTSQCRITDPTVATVVSTLKFYLVLDHRLSPPSVEKELTNTFSSPPVTGGHYLNDITGNFSATNQENNVGFIQNNLLEYPEEETFYMNFDLSMSTSNAFAIMPDYHLLSHTDDGMKLKKLVLKAGLAYLKDKITPTTYDLYVNGELYAPDLSSSDTHTFDFDGTKHLDFDISFSSGSLLPKPGDGRFPENSITATYKIDENSDNQINNYLEMKYTVNGTAFSHLSAGSSPVSDFSLRKFISQNEPEKSYYNSTEDITFEFSKFNMEMLPTPDAVNQYLILDNAVDIENYYIKKIELTGIPSINAMQFTYNLSLKNSAGAALSSQEFRRPYPGSNDRRNITWDNTSSDARITKFSIPDMHFGKDLPILSEEDLRKYADDSYGLSTYLAGYGLKDYKVKVTYAPIPGRELTTQKVLTNTLNMALSTSGPNFPSVQNVSSSKVKITPAAVNDGKLSITNNVYDSFKNPLYTDDEFIYTLTDIDLGTSTDIRIASTLNNNIFEQELPPGTYKVTANDREGYTFLNHKIDNGTAVENKEATITIAENTTTTLTFNNEKQINDGHLVIRQDVTDMNDNPTFTGDVFTYTLKDANDIETTLSVTSTDASNSVTANLKPGTYTVTAKEKDGYHFLNHMIDSGVPVKNKTASITITEDGTVTLAFTNQKITKNGLLSIRQNVTDMNGNPTFTGDVFTYTLKDAQGTESALSVTSTDGSNSVTANLKPGTYTVTANEKEGYDYLGYKINNASSQEGSTVSVTVPEDGAVTLDFTYQQTAKKSHLVIRKIVQDSDGKPLYTGENFAFTLEDAHGEATKITVTSSVGNNVIEKTLAPGNYTVSTAEKDGYQYLYHTISGGAKIEKNTASITILHAQTTTLEFTSQRKSIVTPPKSDENGSNPPASVVKKSHPVQTGDSSNAAGLVTLLLCSTTTIVVVLRKWKQG